MNTSNQIHPCNLLDAKALGDWGENIARHYIEQQGLKKSILNKLLCILFVIYVPRIVNGENCLLM